MRLSCWKVLRRQFLVHLADAQMAMLPARGLLTSTAQTGMSQMTA
jgi:hypothetical protein